MSESLLNFLMWYIEELKNNNLELIDENSDLLKDNIKLKYDLGYLKYCYKHNKREFRRFLKELMEE